MHAPYGLEIVDSCLSCKSRQGFCDLSASVLTQLGRITHQQTYPPATSLFMEGQRSRGVFVLCTGTVKLTTSSREGKLFILGVATAGQVLGLGAALSRVPYEATATTLAPCRLSFIHREPLLDYLAGSSEAGLRAAAALSKNYQDACDDIQEILMAPSSLGKIAKLLLSWTSSHAGDRELRVHPALTHEQIAQMIGASRETVTRILGDLRRRELIRLQGSTLIIRNRPGLEQLAT